MEMRKNANKVKTLWTNIKKNKLFYELFVERTGKGRKTTPEDAKSEKMESQGE